MFKHAASALALAAALCVVSAAQAQRNPSGLPSPRLYQVAPAGAKAGSTVEVLISGRNLEEGQRLVFSNPAVKAEAVPEPKPEIDPKTKQPKAVMGKLPADSFKYKVTIPADAAVGSLDVRLVNKWGVSNARTFVVGDLTEIAEVEPNNDTDKAQKVELNRTINGSISAATDVDYYVFSAKKGERVVVACLASSIDSRLQPGIEIYDKNDRQIAANRNYQRDDAVTDFTAPEDGEYHVRIYQFTHTLRTAMLGGMPAGSSDHFYRLTITTAPWIDSVVPSVVEPGKTASVTVYGRNLPNGKRDESAKVDDSVLEKITMNVTAPAAGKDKLSYTGNVPPAAGWLDGFELRVKNAAGSSNAYLLGLAKAPVVLDTGDNDTQETAQEVTLPCEISGSVEKRRDRDWFTFAAKKGESWNIEVFSNRLGAPTFMTILVHNPATKSDIYESPLAENMTMVSRKFFSRSEDPPIYRFTAPADGKYQLLIASRAGDTLFGARHTYAVRITRDEPDFRLIAMSSVGSTPDVPTAPLGGQAAYTVLVSREDPFSGPVELAVEGLPPGVTCPSQTIGAGVRETTLVLSAADNAAAWSGEIKIKGTATINGQKVVREARAGAVIWPVQANQNLTTESRLERAVWLAVGGKAPFTLTPTLDKATVTQGDKAVLKVAVKRLWPEIKAVMQVSTMQNQNAQGRELPVGLTVNNNQPLNVNANQNEVSLPVNVPNTVVPGTYNIVLRAQTQIPYSKDPMAKQKPNTAIVVPSVAVTITVLPRTLATLTVNANAQTVKAGSAAKFVVRVARQFKYDGEFKVSLVLPPGTQGLEVAEAVIPAGKDEVEILVQSATTATPGNRANLVVRAVALFEGKTPITHEAKVSVNVTK